MPVTGQNATQTAPPRRTRRIVAIAFAVLGGIVVPIVLLPFLSYAHPLPRNYVYTRVDRFVDSVAPYLWPSAPIVPRGDTRGKAVMLWAMSLGINALIYLSVYYMLWYLGHFVTRLIRITGRRRDQG
jgi:hypothetical protein